MSTNISKARREELLRQVAEIRSKLLENKDENTEKLLVYLSNIEKDIDGKKYGLVFEEHREAVDELLENHVPVLVEEESLKINNGGQQNFLIEGDNLASLKLLEKTHKGKIDFIYIDPPYNTGHKDFVYDDAIVCADDKFRHSKWLSFMEKRLRIAYRLLSEKGAIFISIDDNEQAQTKMLLDDIFGADKFVVNLIWNKKTGAKGVPPKNMMVNIHEYIVVYQKNRDFKFVGEARNPEAEGFKNPDNDPRGPWRMSNIKSTTKPIEDAFTITNPHTGKTYTNTWAFSKESLEQMIKEERILWKDTLPKQKEFLYEMTNENKAITSSWGVFDAQNTTVYLKKLLPDIKFDNPKSIELMIHLLNVCLGKNDTILDFFAGSGTTGHAVMKLNAEDGGKRKFILCTNNENNICRDVTYERIKRVIEKEGYKASLKYCKVDFVPISEQVYYEYADKLLLHIKELVELENGLDFDSNKKVAICLTDEDLREYANTLTSPTTYRAVYVGHDVFVTPEIESKLNSLGIKINIIPDYYYGELRG